MSHQPPLLRLFHLPLLAALFASLAIHAQEITRVCSFDPLRIQTVGDATLLTVAGCASWHQAGSPVLPFRTLRLLLPPESTISGVQARSVGEPQSFVIAQPVQHGRLPSTPASTAGDAVQLEIGPDSGIYLSQEFYPKERVELASIQRLDGHTIAILRVYPVQYSPARGEITFAPSLAISLTLQTLPGPVPQPLRSRAAARRSQRERVAAFVDNPEMLKAYPAPHSAERLNDSPIYDYLLITRSNLLEAFQPLVDLKTDSGLSVKAETVESITASQIGQDTPEKIRNYIKHAYDNWGISYVLLGGDVSVVPCRYGYVSMGSLVFNPTVPTDLYYACLDGTWNSDGNSNWGEANDGEGGGDVDLLAEVFVGRAPVETPTEVSVFLQKTLRYAAQRHPNAANVLLLAESLGDTPTGPAQGGDMFDPLVPLLSEYQTTWLDDRFIFPQWRKQDALSAMNQSSHLVLLNGHGNDNTLIGLEKPFIRSIETPDIASLTNQWPFLAYSVGCNVGQFDNDRFSPDAIGEELVKQHSRGAFAAILNSRLGWYDDQDEAKYSGEFQTRFFTHLLSGGHTNFGVANQLSKHDLAGRVESGGIMTYRWCYYEITLFGDPQLAWQAPAPPITFTSRGTPVSWLTSYGWTNDLEAADIADTDNDGMAAWQEYVAGTNPVDPVSVLRVGAASFDGSGLRLEWTSVASRSYSIWAAEEPTPTNFVLVTNNLTATPPTNVHTVNQLPGSRGFFRVGVELVP